MLCVLADCDSPEESVAKENGESQGSEGYNENPGSTAGIQGTQNLVFLLYVHYPTFVMHIVVALRYPILSYMNSLYDVNTFSCRKRAVGQKFSFYRVKIQKNVHP
jgi:hypothetical protein